MDNKKATGEIKKILKNKASFNILIFLLAVLFLWLVVSTFSSNFNKKNNRSTGITDNSTEVDNKTEAKSQNNDDYEKQQTEELKAILNKIDGVGEVEVKIQFEGSSVQVPAVNSDTQTSTTVEDDGEGGTRNTTQETKGDSVVMRSSDGNSEPVIVKTYKPQVIGVIVVAEGADNSRIKYDIQIAVSKLYDIGIDKVNVYSMKK